VQEVGSIAYAKTLPAGTPMALRGKIVSGAFSGYFYAQEPDRSSGIKVVSQVPVNIGDLVDVVGNISLCDGERQINAGMISQLGMAGDGPQPFAMRGDAVGGGPLNAQTPGITGASGAHNMSLLVKTWGVVTANAGKAFTIECRPGTYISIKSGMLTQPAVGKFVIITGISACEVTSGGATRAILPRVQADIVPLD